MKKVLSLVLVIAMVLSSFSFAFAANFEDVEGDYEDAINALVALGVVRGYEDGTFRPENILTRAELAVLLVEALGYGELVAGSTSNFSDTQNHWSNGYVGIAAGTGLVLGYPDGTFKPDQPLTYDEAITMILRAIGYVDSALKGNWPTNFKVKAIDLKLLKDVNMATAAADRGGVAQILFNALELDMMELGEENVLVKAGRLFIDNIATPGTIDVTEDVIDPDHKDYAGDVVDLEPYMFENLDVYFNDDDVVVYVKDSNSTVYEGVVDDVLVRKGVVNVDVEEADESIEKVKFVGYTDVEDFIDVPIYENFVMRTDDEYKQFEDLLDVETIKIVFNENKDGDDVLTGIVVTQQTGAAQIKNEYKEGRTKIDVFRLPVDDDDDVNLEKVVVKGAVESLEDIEEDDVVVEYAGYNDEEELVKTTLVVSRDTVEGKVTKVSGSKFYIGGVAYEENAFTTGILALGNKGTFFLDHNGDVVAFDGDENEPTDYAIVVGVSDGSVKVDRYGNEAIDEYPQLKLVTQEGEEAYYDIYVDIDFDDVANSAGDVIEKGGEYVELETGVKEYDIVIKEEYAKVDQLIKYSMKDDMIEEMKVVKDLTEEGTYANKVDLDKSSNKLASNVVIFEVDEARDGKADKYVVIDEDDLTTEFYAYHDRNSSGEITVLVVKEGELAPSKDTFAFIYGVSEALNDDDDEIAFLEVYYAGEDTEFYTTDDFDVDDFEEGTVIIVDLDGDLIDGDSEGIASSVVTASAINYSSELIKIDGKWYSLAENATVVEVEYVDGEYDDASLADFGDIDKETTEFVFYTTTADGNEIGMILILVNYEAK